MVHFKYRVDFQGARASCTSCGNYMRLNRTTPNEPHHPLLGKYMWYRGVAIIQRIIQKMFKKKSDFDNKLYDDVDYTLNYKIKIYHSFGTWQKMINK